MSQQCFGQLMMAWWFFMPAFEWLLDDQYRVSFEESFEKTLLKK